MRNPPFILGASLFILALTVDGWALAAGLSAVGVLLSVGTVLVFAVGIIWLIYHDDRKLHFCRGWVIIPLGLFGFALSKVLEKSSAQLLPTPENLTDTGERIMTQFQLGLWIVSLLLLFSFVLASSLMRRNRAK